MMESHQTGSQLPSGLVAVMTTTAVVASLSPSHQLVVLNNHRLEHMLASKPQHGLRLCISGELAKVSLQYSAS